MACPGNRKFSYYRGPLSPRFANCTVDRAETSQIGTVEITGLTHTHGYSGEDELGPFRGLENFRLNDTAVTQVRSLGIRNVILDRFDCAIIRIYTENIVFSK